MKVRMKAVRNTLNKGKNYKYSIIKFVLWIVYPTTEDQAHRIHIGLKDVSHVLLLDDLNESLVWICSKQTQVSVHCFENLVLELTHNNQCSEFLCYLLCDFLFTIFV